MHYQNLYGISSFHFYLLNQFNVIPLAVHSVQETSPNLVHFYVFGTRVSCATTGEPIVMQFGGEK